MIIALLVMFAFGVTVACTLIPVVLVIWGVMVRSRGSPVIATQQVYKPAPPAKHPLFEDLVSALMNLGYSKKTAIEAANRAPETAEDFDTALRAVLALSQGGPDA